MVDFTAMVALDFGRVSKIAVKPAESRALTRPSLGSPKHWSVTRPT
jgi:hypothetical protein